MLWLLDDKKPLEEALRQAFEHFRGKYGQAPRVCRVHPSAAELTGPVEGVKIQKDGEVLRGHAWIGDGR
jgi:hypothetical protein